MKKETPNKKTVRSAIRGSVPDGKLRKAKILVRDSKYTHESVSGFTEYDQSKGAIVVKLGAPLRDDASGITVRGHETRHATKHKATRKKPMTLNEAKASQIVDDVNVETIPLPNVNPDHLVTYKRAHLATALTDLRNMLNRKRKIDAGVIPNTIEARNDMLTHAVRVLAMVDHYGDRMQYTDLDAIRKKARLRLTKVIGHKTRKGLFEVIRLAKSQRTRNRAISMLVNLMEVESTREEEEDQHEVMIKHEPPDILSPVVEGTAMDGKMDIRNLMPKNVFCSKEKQITRRFTPDGVNINTARYVNAVVSGDSRGLFARRIRNKSGGVVLIDASGSMHANEKNVAALCALLPTATVAYYSGRGGQGKGELVIYAYNGMRYAGRLPEDSLHDGNNVDLPAIQWMMRLPKPWHLVSDLGFCGGVLGAETIAHALVERATQRGDLTVHCSLDAAYEAFGGKGMMPDYHYNLEEKARQRERLLRKKEREEREAKLAETSNRDGTES
jgi:hypothetical protein